MKKIACIAAATCLAVAAFAGGQFDRTVPLESTGNIGWTNVNNYAQGIMGVWITLPVTATNTYQLQIVRSTGATNIVSTVINTNIPDMDTFSWIPSQPVPVRNGDSIRVLNSETTIMKYVFLDLTKE